MPTPMPRISLVTTTFCLLFLSLPVSAQQAAPSAPEGDQVAEQIANTIRDKGLNRVCVAACTPKTHELLFQETLINAGLNKYLFEMTNIRNQCSWVHKDDT